MLITVSVITMCYVHASVRSALQMLINLGNKLIEEHKAECHCKHIYVSFWFNLAS